MKRIFFALLFPVFLLSCKKDSVENSDIQRCGTVFVQPSWAKNFKSDSLYNSSSIVTAKFHRRSPNNVLWDTTYTTSLQILFSPDGNGKINGIQSFQYRISPTESYPEITLSNVSNLSSVYSFPNSFLNSANIKMRVEEYTNTTYWLIFSNGVSYYSTTNPYEESWLLITR
jgi:hypothetical protein